MNQEDVLVVGGPESRRVLTFIGIWVHRIVPSHLVSISLLIMDNKRMASIPVAVR